MLFFFLHFIGPGNSPGPGIGADPVMLYDTLRLYLGGQIPQFGDIYIFFKMLGSILFFLCKEDT